jgi:hypothetical protein
MLDMKRREFIALVDGGGLLLATKVRRLDMPPTLIARADEVCPAAVHMSLSWHSRAVATLIKYVGYWR